MVRTQIQLPDELHKRAKALAKRKEISLAEITRRGVEMFLDRYPENPAGKEWKFPTIKGGGIKVPLEKLKDFARDEEEFRGLAR